MIVIRKLIDRFGGDLDQTLFWTVLALAAVSHLVAIIALGRFGLDTVIWEYGVEAQCAFHTGHGLCDYHIGSNIPYPSAYMPPLLSYLWLVLFNLFGDTPAARMAWVGIDSVVALADVALLYWLARRWRLSAWSAFFAAAILALYPTFLYAVANYYQTEWAVLFLLLLALLLTRALQAPGFSVKDALLLGLVSGLGTLNRSEMIVIGPVMIGLACALRRTWRPLLPAAAVMILVLTPWTIRNYVTFHRVIPVAQSAGFNVWKGYNRYTIGSGKSSDTPYSPGSIDRWVTALHLPPGPLYETQLQDIYQVQADHYIATAGLPRLLQLAFTKVALLWVYDWTDRDTTARVGYWLPWLIVNGVGVFGLVRLLQTRGMATEGVIIMGGLLALLTAAYAATSVIVRYRMHIEPFLFLLAGVGLEALLRRFWPSPPWAASDPVLGAPL